MKIVPGRIALGIRHVAQTTAQQATRLFVRQRPRVLFDYTGAAGTPTPIARDLYRLERTFSDAVDSCDEAVQSRCGFSPSAFFAGHPLPRTHSGSDARRNDIVLLGLLQIATTDLLRDRGSRPDGTLGISLGELTAAYGAGALTRRHAVAALCVGAAASADVLPGTMFSIAAEEHIARRLCALAPARLDFMGSVSPNVAIVFADDRDRETLAAFLGSRVVGSQQTNHPHHTQRLPGDRTFLEHELSAFTAGATPLAIYSSGFGGKLPASTRLDGLHWHWLMTHPFFYDEALSAAYGDGFNVVVTIGSTTALRSSIGAVARKAGVGVRVFEPIGEDVSNVAAFHRITSELARIARGSGDVRRAPRKRSLADEIDFSDPAVVANPHPYYDALREESPVPFLRKHGTHLILGYDDAVAALKDADTFSNTAVSDFESTLIGADRPAHTLVRQTVVTTLGGEFITTVGAEVESFANTLLRRCLDAGEMDVVNDYARPISTRSISAFLTLDEEMEAEVTRLNGPETHVTVVSDAIGGVMSRLIDAADRRYVPIVSELRERLDRERMNALLRLIWIAGTSTLRRSIATAVLQLLEFPEVRSRVTADESLLPAFMEESLRLSAVARVVSRVTRRPAVISGVEIPAHRGVQIGLAPANRDPSHFDRPHELRLDRARNDHLTFGGGIHRCPGAPTGRIEFQAAIRTLLRVAPAFRAAQPLYSIRYFGTIHEVAMHGLKIAFDE